jgi:thiamine biosynthesis protein ThiC
MAKRAHEKDVQVMIEAPGHVPLNEVAVNTRLHYWDRATAYEDVWIPLFVYDHICQLY